MFHYVLLALYFKLLMFHYVLVALARKKAPINHSLCMEHHF